MVQLKIGVIIVDEQTSFAQRNLTATIGSLKAIGCSEHNILMRHAPRIFGVALTTQFFAEYTDVDAVIILAENDNSPEYQAMMYGVTKLQILWNMPVLVGDCRIASEVADMVAMQNEMEAAAPEHISPDKKSIN